MMKLALRDRGHRASIRSSNAFVLRPTTLSFNPDYVKLNPTIEQTKQYVAIANSSVRHIPSSVSRRRAHRRNDRTSRERDDLQSQAV